MEFIQEYIRNILDLFDEGLYISDRYGNTIMVNKMYEKLTGLAQESLIGKPVTTLIEEGIFDTVVNPEVVRTKKPTTSMQTIHKSKKVMLRGFPVFNPQGEVCLVVTFVRDITVISQFQEQIAQQKEIIEAYAERLELVLQEPKKYSGGYVFESQAMKNLITVIERVAETDATILLLGETGVGKDFLAHICHEYSQRSAKMFLKVDCGSIAQSLIESELFGYVPGAFSGAHAKGKPGFFEVADGGTIFLDEIGELPLGMQTRLLRVLQDGEVVRIGATQPKKVDVRIIAATNRNLEDDINGGKFRRDLYYRLSVTEFRIPSLWERKEDIPPLANLFLERYSQKYKKTMHFTPEALSALTAYSWPGNVRELQNVVQNLVIVNDPPIITLRDIPLRVLGTVGQGFVTPELPAQSLKEIVASFERDFLSKAIKSHGSISKVAELYQVDRTTIFRKLKSVDSETPK